MDISGVGEEACPQARAGHRPGDLQDYRKSEIRSASLRETGPQLGLSRTCQRHHAIRSLPLIWLRWHDAARLGIGTDRADGRTERLFHMREVADLPPVAHREPPAWWHGPRGASSSASLLCLPRGPRHVGVRPAAEGKQRPCAPGRGDRLRTSGWSAPTVVAHVGPRPPVALAQHAGGVARRIVDGDLACGRPSSGLWAGALRKRRTCWRK